MSFSGNITWVSQPWGRRVVSTRARTYSLLSILEAGFVIVAILLLTEGLVPLLRNQSRENIDPSQGDPVMQGLLGSVYVLALLFFGIMPLIRSTWKDKFLLLLLALAALSAMWSVDPDVTLRRAAALIGTSIFGMYFAHRFSFSQQLKLLAITLGVGALLSIAFAVLLPKYGVMTSEHAGEWQGIYLHKNVLGRMMVLGAMCFLLLAATQRRGRAMWWGGLGLCLFVMGMSRSITAVIVFMALMALYPVAKALRWPSWRWRHSLLTPILVFGGLIGAIVLIYIFSDLKNLSALLGLFGRDKTLTGRTELWEGVVYAISKRPWVGYGYGAFWETDTTELNDTWAIARFQAAHAHNGFLQLMLDVGTIGTVVFLLSLVLTLRMAIIWIRRRRNDESFWPLFYLIFMLLYNLTEPTILKHNNVFWMLYVAVVLSLHRALKESRATNTANTSYSIQTPLAG
jgi:exopolysaccharide production protein ExoQ